MQSLEIERRKAAKAARECKAAFEADLAKAKQTVATAEQLRHEAAKQAEAEAHRATLKLGQASKGCKAAKQEASDAQKHMQARTDNSASQVCDVASLCSCCPCHTVLAMHTHDCPDDTYSCKYNLQYNILRC